jgi:hypothetical protein
MLLFARFKMLQVLIQFIQLLFQLNELVDYDNVGMPGIYSDDAVLAGNVIADDIIIGVTLIDDQMLFDFHMFAFFPAKVNLFKAERPANF